MNESDNNEKIDAYIQTTYPSWKCEQPEDQEVCRLGMKCGDDDLPNCKVKGGSITAASWEPYAWLFYNLCWSKEASDKNAGTTCQGLAVMLKLVYCNFDARSHDLEVETRPIRTALHQ